MGTLKDRLGDYFEHAVNTENKWFNWKTGLAGGLGSALITYFINDEGGVAEGFKGAINSFSYVFATAGLTSKLCENLAIRSFNEKRAIIKSSLISTAAVLGAGYLWHKFGGVGNPSPEPFYSAVWSTPINLVSFGLFGKYWHRREKRKQNP